MSEIVKVSPMDLSEAPYSGCENLSEVVTAVESEVRKRGRVVCSVLVNGQRLTDEGESELAKMRVADIHSLSFETEDPNDLVVSMVKTQLALMDEIERLGREVGLAFQAPDSGRAQSLLIDWLDNCRWLTDALAAIKGAQSWLAFDKNLWQQGEIQFRRVVTQILGAVENHDFVLLADLLQYELANGLADWRRLLAGLQK